MLKSMTGYGRAVQTLHDRTITVEMRAVNHRYLDCTVKLARPFIFLEESVKRSVQSRVVRGKLEVFVTIENSQSDDVQVTFNRHLFGAYYQAMTEMCSEYSLKNDISAVALGRYPDVFTVERRDVDPEELTADVQLVLAETLDSFDSMRIREGQKLYEDVLEKTAHIEAMVAQVKERCPGVVKDYRQKLEQRIRELLDGVQVEESRLITETALFADKVAVDEELVRLGSHIEQLRGMVEQKEPIGRKLDFLVQEFNREVNTIGSKANDLTITRLVVDMKSEIEKIREQIQNVE